MSGIAKPNFHAGKVVIVAQGVRISELEAQNHALLSEIERLREIAQTRYELLRECQAELRTLQDIPSGGLVETIERTLNDRTSKEGGE
jgi:hypothetical protein